MPTLTDEPPLPRVSFAADSIAPAFGDLAAAARLGNRDVADILDRYGVTVHDEDNNRLWPPPPEPRVGTEPPAG